MGFEEFSRRFAPRLDSRATLAHWASAFGSERIRVRTYEPSALRRGIVPDFLEHVLGFAAPAGWQDGPQDVEAVNRTLGRDFVEFIRILNQRQVQGLPVFDRDAVLAAAIGGAIPPPRSAAGIADWLSPAERRLLLAAHREGNAALAREFLGRADGRLFAEPAPRNTPRWTPYPGFTAEKAVAVALAVHQTDLHRRGTALRDSPSAAPSQFREGSSCNPANSLP